MRQLPVTTTERSVVDVTTVMTMLPTGDDDAGRRGQKLASREEDLRSAGRYGYVVCTTVAIPAGDYVMIVDTLAREEVRQ